MKGRRLLVKRDNEVAAYIAGTDDFGNPAWLRDSSVDMISAHALVGELIKLVKWRTSPIPAPHIPEVKG